jgi:hypothetical protein
MMSRSNILYGWTVLCLSVALILVELSSYTKMVEVRHFTDKPGSLTPDLTSLAIIILMVSAILAMANPDLDEQLQARIRLAGTGLMCYQAFTNIIISFNHALYLHQMPDRIITDFSAGIITPDNGARIMAIVNGGVLSFAAIIFWQVLAIIVLSRTSQIRMDYQRKRHEEYAKHYAEYQDSHRS